MKKKSKIIVIGGGGHAKVLISVIQRLNEYQLLGYTDERDRGLILGTKYLGTDKILASIKNKHPDCLAAVGVGKIAVKDPRKKIFDKLKKLGFQLPVIISPNAVINKGVNLGEGSVVFDGVIINSGSIIGPLAILNTGCIVEHDCVLGANVSVAPGTVVCGGVKIGDDSFIGSGAVVNQGIQIAKKCLIGSGAVVVKNCSTPATYVGVPAKKV